jgi:hypothetical protein
MLCLKATRQGEPGHTGSLHSTAEVEAPPPFACAPHVALSEQSPDFPHGRVMRHRDPACARLDNALSKLATVRVLTLPPGPASRGKRNPSRGRSARLTVVAGVCKDVSYRTCSAVSRRVLKRPGDRKPKNARPHSRHRRRRAYPLYLRTRSHSPVIGRMATRATSRPPKISTRALARFSWWIFNCPLVHQTGWRLREWRDSTVPGTTPSTASRTTISALTSHIRVSIEMHIVSDRKLG